MSFARLRPAARSLWLLALIRVFALDAETGAQRTPMTYRVRPGGRQFVVVAAGGHGTMGTKLGDELLAYALPER